VNILRPAVLLLLCTPTLFATDVLVPRGATWSYLDDGSDQGSAWAASGFDDSLWATGPAHHGYGDGDEATVVSFGSDPNDKHITSYYRHEFVADPSAYSKLRIRVLRDDGAVVYLNGVEIVRDNMPAGSITSTTLASNAQSGSDEDVFQIFDIALAGLAIGTNVLAVEVHQSSGTSSDTSFDLDLLATDTQFVIRGPYLQLATPDSLIIRWNTDEATDSLVQYGTAPGVLTSSVTDATVGAGHTMALTSLLPATQYWYSVGSTTNVLAGPDATHTFVTPPLVGSQAPMRIWAIGDSGTADALAVSVRDAYTDFTGVVRTDLWMLLGDNAYDEGKAYEYQAALHDIYPAMMRTSAVWPTRGNHDMSGAYAGTFTLPKNGEAGGMPSGTELYYSFDHGNVHFLCLDSESSGLGVNGAMHTWAAADLASTNQDWIIAFWHHPPYTKGSHDSDAESTLITMRQNFLPLLESAGVDLVLNGHSHSYERSFLIDGHYALSSTFKDSQKKDPGDGQLTGSGAYAKAFGSHNGTVYCVAGSSGKTSSAPVDHPVMAYSEVTLGSLVIDVDGLSMNVQFLGSNGVVKDDFTMLKGDFATWDVLGGGAPGVTGVPQLVGVGTQEAGSPMTLYLSQAAPNALGFVFLSFASAPTPFLGGTLHAFPFMNSVALATDVSGMWSATAGWPAGVQSGLQAWLQVAVVDGTVPVFGASLSNAVRSTAP
jgi:hypothetical protein